MFPELSALVIPRSNLGWKENSICIVLKSLSCLTEIALVPDHLNIPFLFPIITVAMESRSLPV
jgi:hypothetical protein